MNYQERCLNLASKWGFEIFDDGDWIRISTPKELRFGNGGCGYGTKYGLDIAETEPRSGIIGRILDWFGVTLWAIAIAAGLLIEVIGW